MAVQPGLCWTCSETPEDRFSHNEALIVMILNFWTPEIFDIPKIQIKRPNLGFFHQKDANGIANSEDPDQTVPLGAV